jgi:hypothetical protein
MKLSFLTEAASAKKQEFLARKFNVDPSIIQQASNADPTPKGRYTEWIVSQIKKDNIKFIPRGPGLSLGPFIANSEEVTKALQSFEEISNKKLARQQYNLQDINQYNIQDLEEISRTYRGEAGAKPESIEVPDLPGVQKIYDDGVIAILEVADLDSVVKLGSGTKWCTSNRSQAKNYLTAGPLHVIYKNGKKFAQTNEEELMDLRNMEIYDLRLINTLKEAGLDTELLYFRYAIEERERVPEVEPKIAKDAELALRYAKDAIGDRWPEAEPYIMKDIYTATNYARDVIGGRWLEFESELMKNMEPYGDEADEAVEYAIEVIKGRWPEAEPYIIKHPEEALRYTYTIIKGRWPEAEPHMLHDVKIAKRYAHHVIKGRWPEAEPYIMYNPKVASYYAADVIKGRWPEAEPYIMKDPGAAYNYAAHALDGWDRWPEAEPYIKKDPVYWKLYISMFDVPHTDISESLDRIFDL